MVEGISFDDFKTIIEEKIKEINNTEITKEEYDKIIKDLLENELKEKKLNIKDLNIIEAKINKDNFEKLWKKGWRLNRFEFEFKNKSKSKLIIKYNKDIFKELIKNSYNILIKINDKFLFYSPDKTFTVLNNNLPLIKILFNNREIEGILKKYSLYYKEIEDNLKEFLKKYSEIIMEKKKIKIGDNNIFYIYKIKEEFKIGYPFNMLLPISKDEYFLAQIDANQNNRDSRVILNISLKNDDIIYSDIKEDDYVKTIYDLREKLFTNFNEFKSILLNLLELNNKKNLEIINKNFVNLNDEVKNIVGESLINFLIKNYVYSDENYEEYIELLNLIRENKKSNLFIFEDNFQKIITSVSREIASAVIIGSFNYVIENINIFENKKNKENRINKLLKILNEKINLLNLGKVDEIVNVIKLLSNLNELNINLDQYSNINNYLELLINKLKTLNLSELNDLINKIKDIKNIKGIKDRIIIINIKKSNIKLLELLKNEKIIKKENEESKLNINEYFNIIKELIEIEEYNKSNDTIKNFNKRICLSLINSDFIHKIDNNIRNINNNKSLLEKRLKNKNINYTEKIILLTILKNLKKINNKKLSIYDNLNINILLSNNVIDLFKNLNLLLKEELDNIFTNVFWEKKFNRIKDNILLLESKNYFSIISFLNNFDIFESKFNISKQSKNIIEQVINKYLINSNFIINDLQYGLKNKFINDLKNKPLEIYDLLNNRLKNIKENNIIEKLVIKAFLKRMKKISPERKLNENGLTPLPTFKNKNIQIPKLNDLYEEYIINILISDNANIIFENLYKLYLSNYNIKNILTNLFWKYKIPILKNKNIKLKKITNETFFKTNISLEIIKELIDNKEKKIILKDNNKILLLKSLNNYELLKILPSNYLTIEGEIDKKIFINKLDKLNFIIPSGKINKEFLIYLLRLHLFNEKSHIISLNDYNLKKALNINNFKIIHFNYSYLKKALKIIIDNLTISTFINKINNNDGYYLIIDSLKKIELKRIKKYSNLENKNILNIFTVKELKEFKQYLNIEAPSDFYNIIFKEENEKFKLLIKFTIYASINLAINEKIQIGNRTNSILEYLFKKEFKQYLEQKKENNIIVNIQETIKKIIGK